MNQTNRTRKNHNRTRASAPRPDATEAALSLILPPTAFKVFRTFLGLARGVYHNPAMTMREALALMDKSAEGFGPLAVAVVACDPNVDINQLARAFGLRPA